MKHNQKEITDALNVIKETCNNENACQSCPLYSSVSGKCHFQTQLTPNYWRINEQTEVWRAFHE